MLDHLLYIQEIGPKGSTVWVLWWRLNKLHLYCFLGFQLANRQSQATSCNQERNLQVSDILMFKSYFNLITDAKASVLMDQILTSQKYDPWFHVYCIYICVCACRVCVCACLPSEQIRHNCFTTSLSLLPFEPTETLMRQKRANTHSTPLLRLLISGVCWFDCVTVVASQDFWWPWDGPFPSGDSALIYFCKCSFSRHRLWQQLSCGIINCNVERVSGNRLCRTGDHSNGAVGEKGLRLTPFTYGVLRPLQVQGIFLDV